MVEGSYHFATGNDVNLNWYHVNNSHSSTVDGVYIDTASNAGIPYPVTGPSTYSTKPTWDAVNLEFGQHVDYSQTTSVRYHAGFEYVRIDFQRIAISYPPAPFIGQSTREISYNGFGPRVGVDASHNFGNGLSAYVKSGVGLYAGSSKFNYNFNGEGFSGGRAGSSMIVVPELEAKAGATYTYPTAHGDISLDAGWLWINYFNPMTYGDNGEAHSVDFGLQGPYVGLKWVGNLA